MKTKLFSVSLFVILMVFSVEFSNNNKIDEISSQEISVMMLANAEANPDCPSGCTESGEGCYCYKFYPFLMGDISEQTN